MDDRETESTYLNVLTDAEWSTIPDEVSAKINERFETFEGEKSELCASSERQQVDLGIEFE